LALLGAESPIERIDHSHDDDDGDAHEQQQQQQEEKLVHATLPDCFTSSNVLLVHSNRDRVVSHLHITQLARMWNIDNIHILESHSTSDCPALTEWADDVQHDFIALELLPKLYSLIAEYLSQF
jgi:hypothetical protein